MTEFEMAYLLTDMQIAMAAATTLTLTIVSGFLVASYMSAHKLNRTMTWLLVGIYSIWWVQSVLFTNRQYVTYANLIRKIHAFAAEGKGLEWHAAASSVAASSLPDFAPSIGMMFGIIVYAASIVFFIQCRRMNKQTEAVATAVPPASTST